MTKDENQEAGTSLQLRSNSPIHYSASTLNMQGGNVHFSHPKVVVQNRAVYGDTFFRTMKACDFPVVRPDN